jgi:hypothetical protein
MPELFVYQLQAYESTPGALGFPRATIHACTPEAMRTQASPD